VSIKEQGKAKREGNMKPKAHKWVDNIDFRTEQSSQANTQPMAMEEALLLGTGAREPGCEQTKKVDQGQTSLVLLPSMSYLV
jgi:hypothetical protein